MKSFMINEAGLVDILDTDNRIFVIGIVGKSDRLTTNKLPNLAFKPDPNKVCEFICVYKTFKHLFHFF